MRLDETGRHAEGVELAVQEVPRLPPGTSLANVLQNALRGASRSPRTHPAGRSSRG